MDWCGATSPSPSASYQRRRIRRPPYYYILSRSFSCSLHPWICRIRKRCSENGGDFLSQLFFNLPPPSFLVLLCAFVSHVLRESTAYSSFPFFF
jgi:hypothetical protein